MKIKIFLFSLVFLGLTSSSFAQGLPTLEIEGELDGGYTIEMGGECGETENLLQEHQNLAVNSAFSLADRAAVTTRILSGVDPKCLKIGEQILETDSDLRFLPIIPSKKPKVEQRPGYSKAKNTAALIQNTFDWIFKHIEKNQPIVNVGDLSTWFKASALPRGYADDWESMSEWEGTKSHEFHFVARNLYGMRVVDLVYVIQYTFGASFDGRGKYLTNVTVYPKKHGVAWGYTLSLGSRVNAILNYGTEEEPLAGIHLLVDHRIETLVKKGGETNAFLVRGDGFFSETTPKMLE